MNGLEARLAKHLPPGFSFTGDHSFWVRLHGRNKNPDFVVRPFRKTKQVVEVFGDYWHTKEEAVQLIQEYEAVGIQCFVLMEHEINENPQAAASKLVTLTRWGRAA